MLRKNEGYLLIECMMGLVLLTVISSFCLSYFYRLHQESKTTKQLVYAINEADAAAAKYGIDKYPLENKKWIHLGTEYTLSSIKGVMNEYTICIVFKGENGKEYKKCADYL